MFREFVFEIKDDGKLVGRIDVVAEVSEKELSNEELVKMGINTPAVEAIFDKVKSEWC